MNLSEIRADIDRIDSSLTRLLCERMTCSLRVADYKRENGMAVYDPVREEQILQKIGERCGEYGDAAKMVYATIMEQSRALQYPRIKSNFADKIGALPEEYRPENVRKIACQGIDGAYSSLTGRALYENADIIFCRTWKDVFDAVERGDAEYGILPVENSWAGSVHEVYDLIIGRKFYIAEAADARISHSLIGLPGAKLSDIKRVISHEQALCQCGEFIDNHGFAIDSCANTAVAVKTVADRADKSLAAIGSAGAAALYGMKILQSGIATSDTNTTRFISISKRLSCPHEADKISIVFSLPHTTGSLYRTLARFAAGGLNLTKIESRPIRGKEFEYLFYVDLSGSLDSISTRNLLGALSNELPEFSLLGNYSEKIINLG